MSETMVTAADINGKTYQVPVSELSWRPSAYGIVIKDKSVLLSKQFDGYDLPGGGIDLGESPEAATIREIKEETGIEASEPEPLYVANSFFKQLHKGGSVIQSLQLYYKCKFVGGVLSTDGFDEHEKVYADMPEWFPVKNLGQITVANSYDWRDLVRHAAEAD